jgi:DNA polymerase-3 subunit alpha
LKLRAATIADLDAAAASAGEGMVVRLADVQGLGAIAQELGQPGKGLVSLVVPGEDGAEVEIALPKRVQVTPALRNRVATLPGVLAVEAV